MAKDLLLEIGTEEIPARFMEPALKQIKELAQQYLTEARLEFAQIDSFGTPRRLALYVTQLAERQTNLEEEVKGPAQKVAFDAEGNPTKAAMGFARGQGVDVKDLILKETESGPYVFATKKSIGQATESVLPGILQTIISKIYFPKPMRWGYQEMRFARPLRWLVTLFGDEVLPLKMASIEADRYTRSHRFLGQGSIEIKTPKEYFSKLEENHVIVDQNKRKQLIWEQIQEVAAQNGGKVAEDEELLTEVTYLLEYPTALCGGFEEKYLTIPKEVLITPMREHQRYFPVLKEDGNLLPKFITVRNGVAEHLHIVAAGNEKVLKARLADAEFFYTEDLKKDLANNVSKLKNIVFHEKLGSLYAKVERVQKLAQFIGEQLGYSPEELNHVQRAAYLAKADLVSNVVYEFPELQGIMGEYYATHGGEPEEVSVAIREHYQPRFAGDDVPQSKVGLAVGIADKLDSIIGFFGMDIQPTGSQDPYALRRQALGICHTILSHNLELSLQQLITKAYSLIAEQVSFKNDEQKTLSDVLAFFNQRTDNILTETGIKYDVIKAVLATGNDNLSDTRQRAIAISEFKESKEFNELIAGVTRVANLAKNATHANVNEQLFNESVETKLYQSFLGVKDKVASNKDYKAILSSIAELREPIDDFFSGVMVMVEDDKVKENRLALLKVIADYVLQIADLSQIVA